MLPVVTAVEPLSSSVPERMLMTGVVRLPA
jgi:hypothetical protein